MVAGRAAIDYKESTPGRERATMQWKKLADATVQGDFGDPVDGSTSVVLCIYDDADALVAEMVVDRAGDVCNNTDCWKERGNRHRSDGAAAGYGYRDNKLKTADGIAKLDYKSGAAGKGKLDAKGANNSAKGQTALPTGVVAQLTGNSAPTTQLVTSDGFCATATMNEVKRDAEGRYSAQLK